MAKVVLFMRDELYVGEKERNEEFRKIVGEFIPYMIEDHSIAEFYGCRIERAFQENPDCELVITTENNTTVQSEANTRGVLCFEWRCFTTKKIVPVKVTITEKNDGFTMYKIGHYGIRTTH